ncbi:MAG: DUF1838 family protein [Steroidobacteraceae bacterium]
MNRRELWPLLGGGALGAALCTAPASAARAGDATAAAAALDLDTLETHVRMRAHPDGRPLYWAYAGTFYGQVSGQRTVPLLGVEGISINRCTPSGDGVYAYSLREAGWFKDLQTGQVLDEWLNPLTGRSVTPKHYYSPQRQRFTAEQTEPVLDKPFPGLEWTGYLGAPKHFAGSVWSSEELLVRTTNPTTGAARVQTSLLTLHATAADLAGDPQRVVPTTMAYQTLASWVPWMDMRDIPGVISWRLFGRKVERVDELPQHLVERTRRLHPQLFEG